MNDKNKAFFKIKPNINNSFGSGFFSNYRICLAKLINKYYNGIEGIEYIDWSTTAWSEEYNPYQDKFCIEKENPFNFWFDQIIPNETDIVIDYDNCDPLRIIEHGDNYFNNKIELERQQYVDKLYIKPKQFILDKINKIYDDEFKDEVVLGVIARGCEFNHWHPENGIFGINDFINKIQETLINKPEITKIFLVSEDSNYINILKDTFTNSYYIKDVFRRTDESLEYMQANPLWPNISNKRKRQNELLGEEVIIQTKLLGKCDYLLGMQTGVFCGAIIWNENIKEIIQLKIK